MPNELEIEKMYSNYFSRDDGIGYSDYPKEFVVRPIDHLLWDSLIRYSKSASTLLDVGCAYGTRTRFFAKKGLKVSGIDISEDAVAYGRQRWGLDLRAGRFESLDIDKKFDAITMIDFVEHLSSGRWAQKLGQLTHPGSLVMILTPDFDCYADYGESWTGYNTSYEHVMFYNRQALATILGSCGYEDVVVTNIRSPPTADSLESAPGVDKAGLFGRGSYLMRKLPVLRANISSLLTWRKLPLNSPRQNSLLFIARKIRS